MAGNGNAGVEKRVLLVIADISGYTRFMLSNRESLAHGQVLINELLSAVLKEVEVPLTVAKLEGDAVFLYAPLEPDPGQPPAAVVVGRKLFAFYDAYYDRLDALLRGNLCHCSACTALEKLRLKVFVHSGTALFYQFGKFEELAGADVITIHRLLKNSVKADEYILLTEPARQELALAPEVSLTPGEERYPEIGRVKTFLCFPPRSPAQPPAAPAGFWHKFGQEWLKYGKALPYRLGLKKPAILASLDGLAGED